MMSRASRVALLGLTFVVCTTGCQHRSAGRDFDESGLSATTSLSSIPDTYDFCQVEDTAPDVQSIRPWNAAMVQKGITDLLDEPHIKGTIWAAYPTAYRRMAAARDESRCSGVLRDDDRRINLINHHLSDVMSRWLVLETSQCAIKPITSMPESGICGVMRRAKNNNLDGLSEALASTAVYISSHLAMALTAVSLDDVFWAVFPDPATQRGVRSLDAVLDARMTWIKSYKPAFDRFNPFLADHLNTVAVALHEAGFVKGDLLNFATYVAKALPCKAALFGSIRDRAFEVALSYSKDPLVSLHPMLKQKDGGYMLSYGRFNFDAPLPKSLSDLEVFAMTAVANPLSLKIYRDVLGGVKVDELESFDPSGCPL